MGRGSDANLPYGLYAYLYILIDFVSDLPRGTLLRSTYAKAVASWVLTLMPTAYAVPEQTGAFHTNLTALLDRSH